MTIIKKNKIRNRQAIAVVRRRAIGILMFLKSIR